MGRLARRALEGDEVIAEWSASDPESYEAAVAVFRRELDSGYTAVRVEGAEPEPVTTLPEDAELVLLTTAMGGG
jgi:hypothetical protein